MLKSNSNKARENIIKYIMERHSCEEYATAPADFTQFEAVAAAIYADFDRVTNTPIYAKMSYCDRFAEYAAGLPGILDTCYYYNRSARADLCGILEETPEESEKYSEAAAEKLLSYLIYREIERSARK